MRNSGLFEASSLSHDTGRSGPEQDRTASYIVLYMSGALGLVYAGTAGLSYSWPALIFALTALLQLLLARAMQRVDDADRAARWKYVDGFKLPVVLLLGKAPGESSPHKQQRGRGSPVGKKIFLFGLH